ncbi:MAG: selenium-dependent molybdenum cofactor biosynthesis protein YqeB, partial [Clostridia bacterium]|nr:selenium-dependent molybdenum cofactor biosynthesis protein YqeB [Clostridia bacterium]
MISHKVVIRGAGDLATGTAHRLWNAGFDVIMLELPKPLVVRRTVSFAAAVYDGEVEVEAVQAMLCPSPDLVSAFLKKGVIPILIDPESHSLTTLKPEILIDAIMSKYNRVTKLTDADLVIGLGPGFTAGQDVHAIIETLRGHNLGRIIYQGSAVENTTEPAEIAGYGKERLLRAPVDGIIKPLKKIGDLVKAGDIVASIDRTQIYATIDGLVRGMLYSKLPVFAGMKVGDIDPRGTAVDYMTISDKAR